MPKTWNGGLNQDLEFLRNEISIYLLEVLLFPEIILPLGKHSLFIDLNHLEKLIGNG